MKKLRALFLALAMIATYSISAQVSINNDGSAPDASAGLDIKFTDKGFLPPRMTLTEREAISSPATGLMVYNTTTNKPNYFNGTEWIAFDGSSAAVPSIGDYFLGGVVFYLDGSGGGLICAVSDQDGGSGIQWYNGTYTVTGATGTAIGTGQSNTTAIISSQDTGSYAAYICDTLTLNGYSDWFLPSKNELNAMYENKTAIDATATENGGSVFVSAYYWNSSEYTDDGAWRQHLATGVQLGTNKNNTRRVRAVRAF